MPVAGRLGAAAVLGGPPSSIELSVAVQHHPSRADLIGPLLERLGEPVDVVADPDPHGSPNPWRTYRHARETTPGHATHRLVVQDDAEPCENFLAAARLAAAARPHRLLVFFVGGAPVTYARRVWDACQLEKTWAVLPNGTWCPAVCVLWPVPMIRPFLDYAGELVPARFVADDEIIGRYLAHSGQSALASVPSLVEHPDVVASTIGKRAHAGADKNRVAACMIPDNCDATQLDWHAGPG